MQKSISLRKGATLKLEKVQIKGKGEFFAVKDRTDTVAQGRINA